MTTDIDTFDGFEQRLHEHLLARAELMPTPDRGLELISGRVARRRRTRHASWVAAAAAVILIAGIVGVAIRSSTSDSAPYVDTDTGTTLFAPGDSGTFVLEPVPDGWALDRVYASPESSGTSYLKDGDDNSSVSILTYTVDPADPQVVQMRQAMENGENGIVPIEVDGHDAYRMPLSGDGRVYGDQIQWFGRPDLVVAVQVPFDAGLDVEAVARDVHEITVEARDSLVVGTSGGGEPGPPTEVMRGTVNGDEWVLSAVLPVGYPLQPQDERRGCANLTFRGETATTCNDRFWTLDDATQVILGGVNFGFGVIKDSSGQVELRQPENGGGLPHPAETVVISAAPGLTWFLAIFDEVCDRYGLAPNGNSVIVGVPPGYPHRTDCTS